MRPHAGVHKRTLMVVIRLHCVLNRLVIVLRLYCSSTVLFEILTWLPTTSSADVAWVMTITTACARMQPAQINVQTRWGTSSGSALSPAVIAERKGTPRQDVPMRATKVMCYNWKEVGHFADKCTKPCGEVGCGAPIIHPTPAPWGLRDRCGVGLHNT